MTLADAPVRPAATEPPADAAAALDRFRLAALALAEGEVVPWYGAPALLQANVRRGADAVLAEKATLTAELPHADWRAVEDAVPLVLAAWHAHAVADRAVASGGRPFADVRDEVSDFRSRFLAAADYLAATGKLAPERVAAVRSGRGPRDLGEDVLAAADLLASVPGSEALVPAADLQAGREAATAYLARLRPAGRKGDYGKAGEAAAAADLRDRVFTLLVRAHAEVWRIGAWRWGQEVGAHVPRLQTRRV